MCCYIRARRYIIFVPCVRRSRRISFVIRIFFFAWKIDERKARDDKSEKNGKKKGGRASRRALKKAEQLLVEMPYARPQMKACVYQGKEGEKGRHRWPRLVVQEVAQSKTSYELMGWRLNVMIMKKDGTRYIHNTLLLMLYQLPGTGSFAACARWDATTSSWTKTNVWNFIIIWNMLYASQI